MTAAMPLLALPMCLPAQLPLAPPPAPPGLPGKDDLLHRACGPVRWQVGLQRRVPQRGQVARGHVGGEVGRQQAVVHEGCGHQARHGLRKLDVGQRLQRDQGLECAGGWVGGQKDRSGWGTAWAGGGATRACRVVTKYTGAGQRRLEATFGLHRGASWPAHKVAVSVVGLPTQLPATWGRTRMIVRPVRSITLPCSCRYTRPACWAAAAEAMKLARPPARSWCAACSMRRAAGRLTSTGADSASSHACTRSCRRSWRGLRVWVGEGGAVKRGAWVQGLGWMGKVWDLL